MAAKSRFAEISAFVSNSRQQYFKGRFYHKQFESASLANISGAQKGANAAYLEIRGFRRAIAENGPFSTVSANASSMLRKELDRTLPARQLCALYENYMMAIMEASRLVFISQPMGQKNAQEKSTAFRNAFLKPITSAQIIPYALQEILDFSKENSISPAKALMALALPIYARIFPKLFASSIREKQLIFIAGLRQTICKSLDDGLKILAGMGENGKKSLPNAVSRKFEDFIALRALWFLKIYFDAVLDAAGLKEKVKSAEAKASSTSRQCSDDL